MGELVPIEQLVLAVRDEFPRLVFHNTVNFEQEAEFAIQRIINGGDYWVKLARQRPDALQDAMRSVAAIGLSLNPAHSHAYLAPRDGKLQLIVGYRGMLHAAQSSGGIRCPHASLVYSGDTYIQPERPDLPPVHKFDDFARAEERGELRGVYVTVKNQHGDWMTTTMSDERVERIRERSESWKAYVASLNDKSRSKPKSTPWINDLEEMWKKTVIRNAAKMWPMSGVAAEHLARAITQADKSGENLIFDNDRPDDPVSTFSLRAHLEAIRKCTDPMRVKKMRRDGQAIASTNNDKHAYDEITRVSREREAQLRDQHQGVTDVQEKTK